MNYYQSFAVSSNDLVTGLEPVFAIYRKLVSPSCDWYCHSLLHARVKDHDNVGRYFDVIFVGRHVGQCVVADILWADGHCRWHCRHLVGIFPEVCGNESENDLSLERTCTFWRTTMHFQGILIQYASPLETPAATWIIAATANRPTAAITSHIIPVRPIYNFRFAIIRLDAKLRDCSTTGATQTWSQNGLSPARHIQIWPSELARPWWKVNYILGRRRAARRVSDTWCFWFSFRAPPARPPSRRRKPP